MRTGGEGFRLGVVGVTGTGKTTLSLAIVSAYLRWSPGLAIVIDAKGLGRYDRLHPLTEIRDSVAHVSSKPLLPGTRVLIFKGSPLTGRDVKPEEISQYAFAVAATGCPVLIWHDELIPFAAQQGQWLGGSTGWVQRTFVTGREFKVSVGWCATDLVQVPLQVSGQSQLLAMQCTPNDVRLMKRRGYTNGLPPGTLETLPGPPLPYAERGVYVRLRAEQPWDGLFYRQAA